MTFVDELRAKEIEAANRKPVAPEPTKEEKAAKERHDAIIAASVVDDIYKQLKTELLKYAEYAKVFGVLSDHYYTCKCIYDTAEYERKFEKYRKKYIIEEDENIKHSEKQKAYLDCFLPHNVFSTDEITCIKKQLTDLLVNDGFRVKFKVEEFKYKVYDDILELLFEKRKYYGYTMSFTVSW